jgi:hypothetical protein
MSEIHDLYDYYKFHEHMNVDYIKCKFRLNSPNDILVITGLLYEQLNHFVCSVSDLREKIIIPNGCLHSEILNNIGKGYYTLDKLIYFIQCSSSCLGMDEESFIKLKADLIFWFKNISSRPIRVFIMKTFFVGSVCGVQYNCLVTPRWNLAHFTDSFFIEMNEENVVAYRNKDKTYEPLGTFKIEYDLSDLSQINIDGINYQCDSKSDFYRLIARESRDFLNRNLINDKVRLYLAHKVLDDIPVDIFNEYNIEIYKLTEYDQITRKGNSLAKLFRSFFYSDNEEFNFCYLHTTKCNSQLYYNKITQFYNSYRDYTKDQNYTFKYDPPEKGLISIVTIPSLCDCNIFASNARPAILAKEAMEHYKVDDIEDMVGKDIYIVRRNKNEDGSYEEPYKFIWKKGTIVNLGGLYRFDSSFVNVKFHDGDYDEELRLTRACIC